MSGRSQETQFRLPVTHCASLGKRRSSSLGLDLLEEKERAGQASGPQTPACGQQKPALKNDTFLEPSPRGSELTVLG